MYLKKLKIGNVELENNLILAPMAGVTDLPFRKICKEFGPGLVCTEMVSSKAIYHDDTKTKLLMNTEGEKRPISMQIFGSDEETMGYAAKYVSERADIVDINMGCPAPKVVKNGDGSKLLLDIEKAEKVIKAVVKNSTKPVTLKIRKGWDCEHIVATEFAQMAEQAGVSAITIHGRTRTEMYSGKADLDTIKKVKDSVNIPVIGNGDVVDEESALKMFEYTGVDGIMIGRGTFGNPWIFAKIKHFLETGGKLPDVSNEEKLRVIKEQIQLELENKPEVTAIREMRKHIAWYTKNMPNSSEFRCEINKIEDKDKLINELKIKLQKLFLNMLEINIKKAETKQEIEKIIYDFRYYSLLQYDYERKIKNVKELNTDIDKIAKKIIDKAIENKVIESLSSDNDTNYQILKNIFHVRIIRLEDSYLKITKEKDKYYLQIFDENIFEEKIEIQKPKELEIKLNKKRAIMSY